MNQVPFSYQSSRPRYLAWGVRIDGHSHDTQVKVNAPPREIAEAEGIVRTFGQEPTQVAKEVLRSGPQNEALQYWERSYRSDTDLDVHVGPGKPSDFTNWHLIPEHVVEAHTQNALEAYLVRYKRCVTRDGPEPGQGAKRPLEGDSDDERPTKRLSSSVQSHDSNQENREPDSSQQSNPSQNPALLGSSFESQDTNQENMEPHPSSRVLQSRQPPNTSFESNVSSNPPDLPGTPTSQQPGLSFLIYESPTGHLLSTIPESVGSHQSSDDNTPAEQSQQTLQQRDEQEQDGQQQGELYPNLLQRDLYQRNQEQRNRVRQNLMARNPLMLLQPQQVPVHHLPPLDISDLLEEEDQGLTNGVHSSVETSEYSPSQQLQDMIAAGAQIFTIHPDEIPDSQDTEITQGIPDLPLALARAPPVNECNSMSPPSLQALFQPANVIRGLVRLGTRLPSPPAHSCLLHRNHQAQQPPQRPSLLPPRRKPQSENRSPCPPEIPKWRRRPPHPAAPPLHPGHVRALYKHPARPSPPAE